MKADLRAAILQRLVTLKAAGAELPTPSAAPVAPVELLAPLLKDIGLTLSEMKDLAQRTPRISPR